MAATAGPSYDSGTDRNRTARGGRHELEKIMKPRYRATTVLAVAAAACSGGDGGGDWQGTVRDSAGIAIVENPAEGVWRGDGPTVTEEVRIGAVDGPAETQFGQIAAVDVASDGAIYVLDQQARRVRVFNPDGTFRAELGGSGSGPGELSQITMGMVLSAGDTVLVIDAGNARITRFEPGGEPVESTPLDMAAGIPVRWDAMPDRRLVNQVRKMEMAGGAPTGEMHDYLLLRSPAGAVMDTVMSLPAGQSFSISQGGMRMKLFEPEPIWVIDQRGRVIFGINAEYSLRVHDDAGRLQRIIRMPFEREPVSDSDRNAFRRFLRDMMMRAGAPPANVDQFVQQIEFADNYPAFASLVAGPGGTLWVQHVRTAAQVEATGGEFSAQDIGGSAFDVFDPEGRFLGSIELPDRFQPLRAVGNRMYGIFRDELDVQHVMVLRIDGLG